MEQQSDSSAVDNAPKRRESTEADKVQHRANLRGQRRISRDVRWLVPVAIAPSRSAGQAPVQPCSHPPPCCTATQTDMGTYSSSSRVEVGGVSIPGPEGARSRRVRKPSRQVGRERSSGYWCASAVYRCSLTPYYLQELTSFRRRWP